ncbi:MAG: sigma-70 family RNA polymerase sigma factor [Victivallales bacterium]|nr:sigma-70 family RNA polymerase sigma factor [Victivallales bacterium]
MNLESSDEKKLLSELKNGNTAAFDVLVDRYAGKLYMTAFGLLSNRQDAEEVVQDAFIRAYKSIGSFRGDASFETWIHRIVINLSRNKYHWNRRRGADVNVSLSGLQSNINDEREPEDINIADESYSPETVINSTELERNVQKGIQELPDTLREALLLRHVEELPYEKIAEALECKIGTVKSRIARGREMLRKILT